MSQPRDPHGSPPRDANRYPDGWDPARVRGALAHYEAQRPDEAVAEDDAAFDAAYQATTHTAMDVPVELVPAVRELIAARRAS